MFKQMREEKVCYALQMYGRQAHLGFPVKWMERFDIPVGMEFIWTYDPETGKLWCEPKVQHDAAE